MISNTLKEIAAQKEKLAALESQLAKKTKALTDLHKKVGLASRAELIDALQSLEVVAPAARRGRKPKGAPKAKKAPGKKTAKKAKASKAGKRTRITDEMKSKIIESLKGGAKAAQVAKDHGVSLPSVNIIKRDAGLTKPRKK